MRLRITHTGQWRRFDRMFKAAHSGRLLRYEADRRWLLAALQDYWAKHRPNRNRNATWRSVRD